MADLLVESLQDFALSKGKNKGTTLFSKIGVVGCGKEGQSIVRIAGWNGLEVVFLELSQEKIDNAIQQVSDELDMRIENWGLTTGEKKAIMSRIKGTLDYSDLADCDFVIESIRSDDSSISSTIEERKEVFRKIENTVREDAIIATNSTTIVITELASELKHPERCISLHFFITSPEARIVEVVKGLYTSDKVYDKVSGFVRLINREVIPVEESAGIISVRLFVTLLNEACQVLMEGVASIEDIDKTMNIGLGMRFGPFRTADYIGLDKVTRWMENLYEEFGDAKYKPSTIILRHVRAKQLGVASGVGFYKYDNKGKVIS